MNKIAIDWWKNKIKSLDINLTNGAFKSELIDENKKIKKFKSLKTFIDYMDDMKDTIQKNSGLTKVSNSYGWNNVFHYLQYFKQEVDREDYKSIDQYTNANHYLNSMISSIGSSSFLMKDSLFFKKLEFIGKNGYDEWFIRGYINFYIMQAPANNPEAMKGWMHGFNEKNENKGNANISKIIDEEYSNLPKLKSEYQNAIEQIKDAANVAAKRFEEIEIEDKKRIEELETKAESQRQALMLKGPVEKWYAKLGEYTGYIYKPHPDKNKQEDLWEVKTERKNAHWVSGKIETNLMLAIVWAILGFGLGFTGFYFLIDRVDDWESHATKLSILLSVGGSFMMFIYGYILRIFIKGWNSARHIAEEISDRIALTQFYLALVESGRIADENKKIALNAIFQKYETGLIKDGTSNNQILSILMDAIKK